MNKTITFVMKNNKGERYFYNNTTHKIEGRGPQLEYLNIIRKISEIGENPFDTIKLLFDDEYQITYRDPINDVPLPPGVVQ
jgi:hypothetical protein